MKKETIKTKIATFAGGCFWCMEAAFEELPGVIEADSGYAGGKEKNPTYAKVCTGKTGHHETIQIHYDPQKISYQELLDFFWKQIDPTDDTGQFADKGSEYTTAIFYRTAEEKKLAEQSKKELEKSGKFQKPIVTKILPFKNFYKAEEEHQGFYKKNKLRYKIYEMGSGRKQFKKKVWG